MYTEEEDLDFLNSTRGKYMVAKALHMAIEIMSKEKYPSISHIEDMNRILKSEAFNAYSVIFEMESEQNGME